MKLWLLKRIGSGGYGAKMGAVVRAETERKARRIAADAESEFPDKEFLDPATTTCDQLMPDGKAELVLVDNAGD